MLPLKRMFAVFGVMGFLMRRFDYPIAPVIIGLTLAAAALIAPFVLAGLSRFKADED